MRSSLVKPKVCNFIHLVRPDRHNSCGWETESEKQGCGTKWKSGAVKTREITSTWRIFWREQQVQYEEGKVEDNTKSSNMKKEKLKLLEDTIEECHENHRKTKNRSKDGDSCWVDGISAKILDAWWSTGWNVFSYVCLSADNHVNVNSLTCFVLWRIHATVSCSTISFHRWPA